MEIYIDELMKEVAAGPQQYQRAIDRMKDMGLTEKQIRAQMKRERDRALNISFYSRIILERLY